MWLFLLWLLNEVHNCEIHLVTVDVSWNVNLIVFCHIIDDVMWQFRRSFFVSNCYMYIHAHFSNFVGHCGCHHRHVPATQGSTFTKVCLELLICEVGERWVYKCWLGCPLDFKWSEPSGSWTRAFVLCMAVRTLHFFDRLINKVSLVLDINRQLNHLLSLPPQINLWTFMSSALRQVFWVLATFCRHNTHVLFSGLLQAA